MNDPTLEIHPPVVDSLAFTAGILFSARLRPVVSNPAPLPAAGGQEPRAALLLLMLWMAAPRGAAPSCRAEGGGPVRSRPKQAPLRGGQRSPVWKRAPVRNSFATKGAEVVGFRRWEVVSDRCRPPGLLLQRGEEEGTGVGAHIQEEDWV